MPRGANASWRTYPETSIGQITRGSHLVLHTGDMVEGRWGQDVDGAGVFGPVGTYRQRTAAAVWLAGDTYYRYYRRYWTGLDVPWGRATTRSATSRRRRPARHLPVQGTRTLEPRLATSLRRHPTCRSPRHPRCDHTRSDREMEAGDPARVPAADFDWLADRVQTMRRNGSDGSSSSPRSRPSVECGSCHLTAAARERRSPLASSPPARRRSAAARRGVPRRHQAPTTATPRSRWSTAASDPGRVVIPRDGSLSDGTGRGRKASSRWLIPVGVGHRTVPASVAAPHCRSTSRHIAVA